jgi:formylglycine-generating enzyme required for sulfatase activity
MDYYKNSADREPQGPDAGSFRVLRGGSFLDPARDCRAACRHDLGFRVVLVR